jgi:hypothetical protein
LSGLAAIFFFKKTGKLLIVINNSTSTLESKKKIQIDFLTIQRRTKDANMSRRCTVILGPPFAEAGQSLP